MKVSRRTRTPVKIGFQRIIIFGSLAVLFFVAVGALNKKPLTQAVAGISIVRPLFSQATVSWEAVSGAVIYNIYYKGENDSDFTNAVRNISANITSYTISYLRKGVEYDYRISAADASGKEFYWSGTNKITNLQSM